MKTNLLKVAFVAAIALVSGLNVFKAQKSEILSDVALANVEALAQNESDGICRLNIDIPCIVIFTFSSFDRSLFLWIARTRAY